MLSVFCSPSRYVQGKGATAALGQELASLGLVGPVLIIAGNSAVEELADIWSATLGNAGFRYELHRFGGECSSQEIQRGQRAAETLHARLIVGAGGGKVLDAARAVAADLNLPVAICPTVASTDAPTSALSVIYTEEGVFQEYRFYRKNPDLVLVDSQVIAHSPPRLFVAGMGDAMSTYFEAKACHGRSVKNMRGGMSTRAAFALAELCHRTVLDDGADARQAVESQVVTPALERVIEANTLLSGLGFESSGLAAAHAVHNGLTAAPETHEFYHGEKVAFGVLVQLVLEGQPRTTVDEVLSFYGQVGLPMTLSDIGLEQASQETIRKIAERASAVGETIHNEPFEVRADMVADAIVAADAIGRLWLQHAGCNH